jgi:hypothetical protein
LTTSTVTRRSETILSNADHQILAPFIQLIINKTFHFWSYFGASR